MKSLLLLPVLFAASLPLVAPQDPAAPAGQHDWVVDPVHSSMMFRIKHADSAWFYGSFDSIEGTVRLDPNAPETGKVELAIAVDSVHTHNTKRDDHLKSPDFFNSKENPKITFTTTAIAKKGETYEVTGELQIAGVKKSQVLVVEKTGEAPFHGELRSGWSTAFTIKRSDYGMKFGLDDKSLGDDVTMWISLSTIQPKK